MNVGSVGDARRSQCSAERISADIVVERVSSTAEDSGFNPAVNLEEHILSPSFSGVVGSTGHIMSSHPSAPRSSKLKRSTELAFCSELQPSDQMCMNKKKKYSHDGSKKSMFSFKTIGNVVLAATRFQGTP